MQQTGGDGRKKSKNTVNKEDAMYYTSFEPEFDGL